MGYVEKLLNEIQKAGLDINEILKQNSIDDKIPLQNKTAALLLSLISPPETQYCKRMQLDRDSKEYYLKYTQDYIDFTYNNPTTYHFIDGLKKLLSSNGFTYLSEKEDWSNLKAGLYYTTRSDTCISAFAVGRNWEPLKGVAAIGSHADSLTVKLKPNSVKPKNEGYELVGVAPYAGGLSDKWWDRDLGFGGRVLVKNNDNTFSKKLVNSTPHPIAHIASMVDPFQQLGEGPFNLETQMVPIIGFDLKEEPEPTAMEKKSVLYGKHSLKFLRHIANLANVEVSQLQDFDFDLFDVHKGCIGGISNEFFFAPRIDDKLCSFAAINSLIEYASEADYDESFVVVTCYDNEELGSLSRQGARGGIFELVVDKVIAASAQTKNVVSQTRVAMANSIILSADVTHAYNPNFDSAYLKGHSPLLNTGIVVKFYNETKTSTDKVGLAFVKLLANLTNNKIQIFKCRNDIRSGSTIGSFISSQTGARTIDVGIPQLAMHSIRGMSGSQDIGLGIKFFVDFFKNWKDIYNSFGDL